MKSVLCEMKICTLRNEICTLRNENLYFAKWNLYFAKWKSVLCEMKICTLRNENLYFAKWKSVLCETKICTLRNENLFFEKRKSVLCEMKICNFMKNFYFLAIMTVTHISEFCHGIERRVLGVLKTQISKPGTADKKKPIFQSLSLCLPRIASAKLALSIVLSPPLLSALGGPALLCFATRWLHTSTLRHSHYVNNSEGCLLSYIVILLYCVTEVYNERRCYSNTFLTVFCMSRVKLQKYQTSGEEF